MDIYLSNHRTPRPRLRRAMWVRGVALVLAAAALVACEETVVPDLNNPGLEDLTENPSREQVSAMASGLLVGDRQDYADIIRDLESIGRDAYNFDPADPRFETELLRGPLTFTDFGADHWAQPYRNVRNANVMIRSVATAEALSEAEKNAARGYARTIKALDLMLVASTRDSAGIVIDADRPINDPGPILCRDNALTGISLLLDSAKTDLLGGGDAFPFSLPSGFAGFDAPPTFLLFNRALKARLEIWRRQYPLALEALGESFVSTEAPLTIGIYHNFGLTSGDLANPLYQDPATTIFRAHPSVATDAEPGDLRLQNKVTVGENLSSPSGQLSSDLIFTVYDSPTDPIPIIRNEELILLRAEANIGLGQLDPAREDINFIRVNSGGLSPRAQPYASADEALTDLLYNKRYSLLWESGSRWIDARLYGRLGTIPPGPPGYAVHPFYPIPEDERNARNGNFACQ